MRYAKINRVIGHVLLLIVFGVALASSPAARTGDTRPPDLPPSVCNDLQIPAGNKVAFRAYARGVQIYRWNGAKWVFVAPVAMLFADANYNGQIGIHYAGPTWESNSGSSVKAARLIGCSPDATAIDWLKLQANVTNGPGIFSSVTYIQRVNTTGGLPPSANGTFMDEAVEVPYTAEYYFYRAED